MEYSSEKYIPSIEVWIKRYDSIVSKLKEMFLYSMQDIRDIDVKHASQTQDLRRVYYSHFQQYFKYIVAVSFIGGGNRITQKNTNDLSQVTNKLYHKICIDYTSPGQDLNSQRLWW